MHPFKRLMQGRINLRTGDLAEAKAREILLSRFREEIHSMGVLLACKLKGSCG